MFTIQKTELWVISIAIDPSNIEHQLCTSPVLMSDTFISSSEETGRYQRRRDWEYVETGRSEEEPLTLPCWRPTGLFPCRSCSIHWAGGFNRPRDVCLPGPSHPLTLHPGASDWDVPKATSLMGEHLNPVRGTSLGRSRTQRNCGSLGHVVLLAHTTSVSEIVSKECTCCDIGMPWTLPPTLSLGISWSLKEGHVVMNLYMHKNSPSCQAPCYPLSIREKMQDFISVSCSFTGNWPKF